MRSVPVFLTAAEMCWGLCQYIYSPAADGWGSHGAGRVIYGYIVLAPNTQGNWDGSDLVLVLDEYSVIWMNSSVIPLIYSTLIDRTVNLLLISFLHVCLIRPHGYFGQCLQTPEPKLWFFLSFHVQLFYVGFVLLDIMFHYFFNRDQSNWSDILLWLVGIICPA